jgi:hypothetical protein
MDMNKLMLKLMLNGKSIIWNMIIAIMRDFLQSTDIPLWGMHWMQQEDPSTIQCANGDLESLGIGHKIFQTHGEQH